MPIDVTPNVVEVRKQLPTPATSVMTQEFFPSTTVTVPVGVP